MIVYQTLQLATVTPARFLCFIFTYSKQEELFQCPRVGMVVSSKPEETPIVAAPMRKLWRTQQECLLWQAAVSNISKYYHTYVLCTYNTQADPSNYWLEGQLPSKLLKHCPQTCSWLMEYLSSTGTMVLGQDLTSVLQVLKSADTGQKTCELIQWSLQQLFMGTSAKVRWYSFVWITRTTPYEP